MKKFSLLLILFLLAGLLLSCNGNGTENPDDTTVDTVETEPESQQDTEKVSDTDTGEENTTTQETEKAPSNGGCSGSVQGMSMLLLFVFAAMIPAVKRKKEIE